MPRLPYPPYPPACSDDSAYTGCHLSTSESGLMGSSCYACRTMRGSSWCRAMQDTASKSAVGLSMNREAHTGQDRHHAAAVPRDHALTGAVSGRLSVALRRVLLPFGRMKAWCAEDERLPGPGAGAESDAGQAWMRPPSRHCFRHVVPFTALYAATSTMDLQGQACVDASERAPYD